MAGAFPNCSHACHARISTSNQPASALCMPCQHQYQHHACNATISTSKTCLLPTCKALFGRRAQRIGTDSVVGRCPHKMRMHLLGPQMHDPAKVLARTAMHNPVNALVTPANA
eukprot:scaffold250842_cov24-Tisochrysis_lutea.AAC.1